MDPVVGETPVITGPGTAVELTDTLSNVAVTGVDVLLLATARPTYTFPAMLIVAVPYCVHYTPSADAYPVNALPLLTNFNHTGRP